MSYIVWLDDSSATSPELVGAKAASLAALARTGLPVPAGFCLTTEAISRQIRVGGLEQLVRETAEASKAGQEWRRLATELRASLASVRLEHEIESQLLGCMDHLLSGGPELLAVRSSALVEDRPDHSFAGQFSTFLGVGGFEELLTAVRACWASRWSDRVMAYAQAHEVGLIEVGMAVVVQKVVPAESAGTATSVDPVSGDRDVMVVNAAWGLGRAVGEGEIVPDSWRLDRAGLTIVERRLGHKPLAASVGPQRGEIWRRLSPERARAACLDDATLVDLGQLILRVEALFGAPQEVEWAFAAGQLWLLQARTLGLARAGQARPPLPLEATPLIQGQPTSAGWATGRARVVRRPEDMALVQPGEILVASFMRPTMTALLPLVAGLVIEAGGSTSHVATLARERRIPAIMGAADAAHLIPNGALVLVDGSRGRVYIQ